jgi:hypothetical protein
MDVPAQHLYSLQAAGTVRCYWLPLLGESLPRAMSPVRRDMVRVHTNHIALQEREPVFGSAGSLMLARGARRQVYDLRRSVQFDREAL